MGDWSAVSISPKQKSKANSMPKPSDPLIRTLSMMDVGTALAALVISSDIWEDKSVLVTLKPPVI